MFQENEMRVILLELWFIDVGDFIISTTISNLRNYKQGLPASNKLFA